MQEILQIDNFKCFTHQEIQLRDLTVMVGANGMGKSSVMQSLLLLRQCIETTRTDSILLNGPYALALGSYASVVSRHADGEITLRLKKADGGKIYAVNLNGTNEIESFALKKTEIDRLEENNGLLAPVFYFLSAERVGPKISQRVVEMEYLNCGVYGENTGQVLSSMYYNTKVRKELWNKDSQSPFLKDQVNAWLNDILPGNEVTAEISPRMQTAQILLKNNISDGFIESTNLGFGISYCLPIIVTGLIAQKGSFFIVENPEAHLHPSAQTAIGKFLSKVADAGIRVVVETHSDHILDGIQIYVAQNLQMQNNVVINNFGMDARGTICVTPITYTDKIEYSEWPVGFMDATSNNYAEFLRLKK